MPKAPSLEVLKKGASECDAAIHLAFDHNFDDFAGSCAKDAAAITGMGSVLAAAGGDRVLVITSGTMMLARGQLGDEDDGADMTRPMSAARGASEQICLDFAKQGVRAIVVRLPPTTHGPGHSGFMSPFTTVALQNGVSSYVSEGRGRWCSGHRDDAAKLYRLAVEKAKPGSIFHAVAEEGVSLNEIATKVGNQLNIRVVSIQPEHAQDHFGGFYFGATADNQASSTKTRERLGWTPMAPRLIEDIPVIIDFIKSRAA